MINLPSLLFISFITVVINKIEIFLNFYLMTEAVTVTESVAVAGAVTETEAVTECRGRVELTHVMMVSNTLPPKGPGCAPDVPYDEPDRPKGPF